MNMRLATMCAASGLAAAMASAQPRFVAIPGFVSGVSDGGNVVVGSNGENAYRWVRSGNTATLVFLEGAKGGTPTCSADGSRVACDIENGEAGSLLNGYAATNIVSGRWSTTGGFANLGVFTTPTPIPGIGTPIPPGYLNTPSGISEDGNIVVGLAYVLGGDPFSAFRGFRADVASGTLISLPQLGGQGSRAYCVSGNGLVIGGFDRSPLSSADRPSIWRFNPLDSTFSQYVFDTPNDDVGQIRASNFDGSQLAGSSTAFPDQLVRWDWNGATYVPTALGTMNGFVTVSGMTRDGSVIVGTTGSFFFGQFPFIWTAATGMVDLNAYLVGLGITGLPAGANIGSALSISPDGAAITVGGFGSPSGVVYLTGGPECVGLLEVEAPNLTEVSACNPTAILNVSVAGSGPFLYQWRKNGFNISDGETGTGSTIFGATGPQVFINGAGLADAGSYDCVVSNACSTITSSARVITTLPPDPHDTCATALEASGTGTFSLAMCGAYINESPASCVAGPQAADVWIRYTPSTTGDYRITTCDQPGYDTILSVYNSCGGAETACNGDFCFSLASIDRIALTAGVPIYVRLGVGFVAPPEPVQVTFGTVGPAPANDLCENAEILPGAGSFPLDSSNAGRDGTSSCGFDTGRDVWFRYTAPSRGNATFTTCGSLFDTVLAVFTDCGGAERGCDNNAFVDGCTFQSIISDLPMNAGTSVLVRVAGSDQSVGGTGTLNVTFVESTGCIADFNGDGDLNPDDLGDFINCYFEAPPCAGADFNLDGGIDPDDLGDYINVYFAGCP